MRPKVSVILPVYNGEEFILPCLNSLVSQTLSDIEIICVDDGSRDNSLDILSDYAKRDNRITIIQQENSGPSIARNAGLKIARGEYVALVDNDDWVSLDFYEKLYHLAQREKADIAAGDTIYCYKDRQVAEGWVHDWTFKPQQDIIQDKRDKKDLIYACACWYKIYKTDFLKEHQIEFPPNMGLEDAVFTFMTTICANKIALDPTAHYFYRQRDDSIMALAGRNRYPFNVFKSYQKCSTFLERVKLPQEDIRDYKLICEDFAIHHMKSWIRGTHPSLQDEFFTFFKGIVSRFEISNNPFLTTENRDVYQQVIKSDTVDDFLNYNANSQGNVKERVNIEIINKITNKVPEK